MLDDYPLDPLVDQEVLARLLSGTEKYKESWCEVDLKTDMLEEMYDILNYARMILLRCDNSPRHLPMDPAGRMMRQVLAKVVGDVTELVIQVQRFVPDFEGPTSNEWIKARRKEAELA